MYFGQISDSCATILGILFFIRELLKIVCFLIPMALIVMLALDFFKGVISPDDGKSKVINLVIKRILYAVIIFLLPSTVFGLFNILGLDNKDSNSCWVYAGETSVQEVKEIMEEQEEALIKKEEDKQEETPPTGGNKTCSKKTKIRLTSFDDPQLRNSIDKSKIGSIGNYKTYTYNGKEYLVIATAMKNTAKDRWRNPVDNYNFKDYDVLTLQIEGKVYDALVLDICGACATSTDVLKIDLWTTNNKQSWSDYQYLCTN